LCGLDNHSANLDNHSANLDNHSESRHATPMTSPLPETIELRCDSQPVPYREALALMEARNMAIAEGTARELVWLLEHPPVYTAGTSANEAELLDPRFEVVAAGRGGRYTYHGPGQRICYVLLDLKTRARDVRGYVHALEGWMIAALSDLGITSFRREGRIGIWTQDIDGREAKIGAIGVRMRRWVTMHGFSVNLDPDLAHFSGIIPCGIGEFGVTSCARLGHAVASATWDRLVLARAGEFLAALEKSCLEETDNGVCL
jgi:lipoyl(octanoyl) transferase